MSTSSNQGKKKKTKVRKLINRAKNGLQRARKFCKQHVAPVMLATAILGGVIFGTYLRATATGVEELFYTYWDLVSSIFAAEGYDMTIKNGNDQISTPDRVTGRQLWNNIKTWVKLKCEDAKELYDEFMLLPKAVTAEGIKMSKDLFDLLGEFCEEFTVYQADSTKIYSSRSEISAVIAGVCGVTVPDWIEDYYYDNQYLEIYTDGSSIFISFSLTPISRFRNGSFEFYDGSGTGATNGIVFNGSYYEISKWIYPLESYTWIVKNGVYYGDIFEKIKDPVDLKNAPDQKVDDNIWNKEGNEQGVLPWWYYPDLLDRSMRDQAVDDEKLPEGDPDDGDDNKDKNGKSWKDILPALIPWNPTIITPTETETDSSTEKDSEKDTSTGGGSKPYPGSSENPTETETEKDTEDKVTDSGQLPAVAENTGNWERLFPFCIPWDIMSLVKSLKADKKAPRFTFKYTFKVINYTWTVDVDMADYWKYIKIFRWGMTIFFIIGLFFLTVKFTTFVYRMGG